MIYDAKKIIIIRGLRRLCMCISYRASLIDENKSYFFVRQVIYNLRKIT